MILTLHILIALTSLVSATYVFFAPTVRGLQASYVLVALTIASGTYLVISQPASLTQACASGLTYLAIVTISLVFARRRLSVLSAI